MRTTTTFRSRRQSIRGRKEREVGGVRECRRRKGEGGREGKEEREGGTRGVEGSGKGRERESGEVEKGRG